MALAMSSSNSVNRQTPRDLQQQKQQRYTAPNKRTSLQWVIQSIERYGKDPRIEGPPASPQLLKALHQLQDARTQRDVAEAGRQLMSLNLQNTETPEIQERVIKAVALSGLLVPSISLLEGLLSKGYLPSSMSYVAVCISLRQAGKVTRLEELLCQLGVAAKADPLRNTTIDVIALNTYLAALCDEITKNGPSSPSTNWGTLPSLATARDWLKPGVALAHIGTEPDATSYSTVMHAAACVGNRAMVDDLWNEMRQRGIPPNRYAYNSLLRAMRKGGSSNDAEILDLLDCLMKEPLIQPDQYTIDLVLIPLIRANRIGDVESLLGNFMESRSGDRKTISNAIAAFLDTLVKGGELGTARAIFDTYVVSPKRDSADKSSITIAPSVRHFNFLIDGYRRVADAKRKIDDNVTFDDELLMGRESLDYQSNENEVDNARQQGRDLYNSMLKLGISPDVYTLTSMLQLCSNSSEITEVFQQAVTEVRVEVTPAVVRATMTAYGNVGDASSACFIFDRFSCRNTMSSRTWNAFLSALASGCESDGSLPLSICSSAAAQAENGKNRIVGGVSDLLEGTSCFDAITAILQIMGGFINLTNMTAPKPDSQTFCIAASALQHGPSGAPLAMQLFRNATESNVPADGRFLNAVLRCFGEDISGALSSWKQEIRRACLDYENRTRTTPLSIYRTTGKNLIASYHGLLYVSGRALRPDIAVRLVYAMNKDGIEPNEVALNCYLSGKRARQRRLNRMGMSEVSKADGIGMSKQFESILSVECTKYDKNDKRRAGEKRVRIIL